MCFSTWLGFCDFEFFLCWTELEPVVEEMLWTWPTEEFSTTEVLIADYWEVLYLTTVVPGMLPGPVLWARWMAARSFAFTGFTEEPPIV
jgi:hypothetical protein